MQLTNCKTTKICIWQIIKQQKYAFNKLWNKKSMSLENAFLNPITFYKMSFMSIVPIRCK